jgi:hypothetical protein
MDRSLVLNLSILDLPGVLATTVALVAAWNVFRALSSALVHKEG